MNVKKMLAASLGFLLLLAPTTQLVAATQPPTVTVATENDANITLAVKKAFSADAHLAKDASAVQIATKDGVVTLSGKVSNQEIKDLFKKKAQGVHGVKSVTNDITVK
ncbi:MAG: BON domain-containing protein [Parachlamydia sp.]|nr:BON domain-containing protein [Parachlamydia sp.]